MSIGPVEATERAAEDVAIRFLLDGLGVGTLHELHGLVEAGQAAMLARAPRGGDAAALGPRGHSNEATSLPAQTAPQPVLPRAVEGTPGARFMIEDPVSGESFVVDGDIAWTALIAGYTKFPEPRRERDGWPVMEPATADETMEFLRSVLRPGIHG